MAPQIKAQKVETETRSLRFDEKKKKKKRRGNPRRRASQLEQKGRQKGIEEEGQRPR